MIATARCRVRAAEPASPQTFCSCGGGVRGSEVADPGLPGRPALIGAEISDGVINIDAAAHRGGVGKHIGGIAEL